MVLKNFKQVKQKEKSRANSVKVGYTADVVWALQLFVANSIKDGANISSTRKKFDDAKKRQPRQLHLKCLKNRQGNNYDCYFNYFSAHDFFTPATLTDFELEEKSDLFASKLDKMDDAIYQIQQRLGAISSSHSIKSGTTLSGATIPTPSFTTITVTEKRKSGKKSAVFSNINVQGAAISNPLFDFDRTVLGVIFFKHNSPLFQGGQRQRYGNFIFKLFEHLKAQNFISDFEVKKDRVKSSESGLCKFFCQS